MKRTVVLLTAMLLLAAVVGHAEVKTVTVPYLRAAITAIEDRGRVRVTAKLDQATGLNIAEKLWLRNKGYSRFSIIDPETGAVFDAMYCKQESDVFDTLIRATSDKVYTFYGERGRGDRKEPAIFVSEVREAYHSILDEDAPVDDTPRTYRVVMTDKTTSNRTVLVNVELGKQYNVFGSWLMIEEEPPPDPNRVVVDAE